MLPPVKADPASYPPTLATVPPTSFPVLDVAKALAPATSPPRAYPLTWPPFIISRIPWFWLAAFLFTTNSPGVSMVGTVSEFPDPGIFPPLFLCKKNGIKSEISVPLSFALLSSAWKLYWVPFSSLGSLSFGTFPVLTWRPALRLLKAFSFSWLSFTVLPIESLIILVISG